MMVAEAVGENSRAGYYEAGAKQERSRKKEMKSSDLGCCCGSDDVTGRDMCAAGQC